MNTYRTFYVLDTADQFDFTRYDYIVDAIDTVTGKLELIEQAHRCGTPIISPMGAGKRWRPPPLKWRTSTAPPSARWPESCGGSSESGASRR